MLSIGSKAELKEHADNCPDDIELHRPYIDAVTCTCPKCKGKMKRVPEVIDCWFDSGSMPNLHSTTIHLRIRKCLNSSSLLSSFQKPLTRQEAGSTHFLPYQHFFSIKHLMKMLSYLVMFRMQMDRR